MKIKVTLPVLLLLMTTPVVASAQKSTKSTLTRAAQYFTRTEAAIKKANGILDKSAEGNSGQILDSALKSATNQAEQAKELLDKGEELLKSVADSEPEKAPVQKSFEEVTTSYNDLIKRLEGAKENVAKNDANNAAGAANDQDTIEALTESLAGVRTNSLGGNKPNIELIDLYPQIKKDIEAMLAKYGESNGSVGSNREFTAKVKSLKTHLQSFETELKTVWTKKMTEKVQGYKKLLQHELEIGQNSDLFTAFQIGIPSAIDTLQRNCHVYTALGKDHPDYKPALIDEANALMKLCKEETAKKEKQIISENKVPTAGYTGADKDSLTEFVRTKFMAKHPGAKIKRIILEDSSWLRVTGWKWSSSLAWYKEDYSTTDAYVITASDKPEYCHIWGTPLVKNHMSGSQLQIVIPNDISKPYDIFSIILSSKLK